MTQMAESIVAEIPFNSLIDNKPVKLTKTGLKSMTNKHKDVVNAVRDFIVSTKSEKSPKNIFKIEDFDNIKKGLEGLDSNSLVTTKILGIPDEDKDDVALLITDILGYIKRVTPSNQSETLFGTDERDPSNYEISKFLRIMNVLDNPFVVIDLMNSGTITGAEIDALSSMYPELLDLIKSSIVEALIDVRTKLPTTTLGRQKNAILSTVLQIPRLTPEALQQLQGSFSVKEGGKSPSVSESVQTDTQRIQFK